jgi:hypothetical protein
MAKIKIAFRQIFDINSQDELGKRVFHESFTEFCMQAQAYNPDGKLKTFHELVQHNPKANSLHYKVGFSVGLYIAALKNIIPGLEDSIGNAVAFESHEFKILVSDLSNKAAHKVAIVYYTDWIELLAITSNYLIVGYSQGDDKGMSSLTIRVQENLSVAAWRMEAISKFDNVKHEGERKYV